MTKRNGEAETVFSIAICDNEELELHRLESAVRRWLADSGPEDVELDTFLRSAELAERLRSGAVFDLLLLDIIMPEVNGIELGRLVREHSAQSQIVYTTSSKDFAFDAFGNHASDYLLKPVDEKKLFEVLDFALAHSRDRTRRLVSVRTREGVQSVDATEIVYIENEQRAPVYHMRDGAVVQGPKIRTNFDEAIAPLDADPAFLSPHKSYWVNMRYIRGISGQTITLDTGRELFINRPKTAEVNRAYLRYLSGGGARG